MTKNNYVTHNKESGFVALFFVLIFASALGFLILILSLKSKNMLTLFQSMKNDHAARVAADYCLQKLIQNKIANIGYKPPVGVDIQISDGLVCRYKSYIDAPEVAAQQIDVRRGTTIHRVNVLQKFTVHVLATYSKNGTFYASTSHDVVREYFVTDSL